MVVDAPTVARLRALALDTDVEVCGALIGERATIKEAWPLANRSPNGYDSFLIPAEEVLRVEREAEARGLELIGFYHSHPRGTPVPSRDDLIQALPGYIYLIVAHDGEMRAWRLRPDRSGFDEVLT